MHPLYLVNDYVTNGFLIEYVDIIYLLSILLGALTIISKNPVVSVLYLIGLFVNIAGLLILIGCNFIGLAYILVYVGAVSILFLFILMLINIRISELLKENNNDIPLAIITAISLYYILVQVLPTNITDNTVFSRISNVLTEVNSLKIENEFANVLNFKEISYASSKGWDSSLIEPTHIASIGNVMYTSHSMWLIISSIILLLGMVGAIVITIKQK